MLIFRKV